MMTPTLELAPLVEVPSADVRRQEPLRLSPPTEQKSKILIVDDESINIKVARKYLMLAGYTDFAVSTDPTEVMALLEREKPDLLLLDIMMPGVSGLDILRDLRAEERYARLPVLILTAIDDREVKARALNLGATDFLPKPVDPTDLVPRVRNALVLKAHHDHLQNYARELEREVRARTAELEESRQEVIHCLARAAEYRDSETGRHIIRVGRYVGIIARELGLDESTADLLAQAALLHDVGKIGIGGEDRQAMPRPRVGTGRPHRVDAPRKVERLRLPAGFGR